MIFFSPCRQLQCRFSKAALENSLFQRCTPLLNCPSDPGIIVRMNTLDIAKNSPLKNKTTAILLVLRKPNMHFDKKTGYDWLSVTRFLDFRVDHHGKVINSFRRSSKWNRQFIDTHAVAWTLDTCVFANCRLLTFCRP